MVQQDGESLNLARGDSKVHRRPLVGKRLHGNSFGQEQPHSVAVALRWSRGTNKFRPNDSLAQLHDQTYYLESNLLTQLMRDGADHSSPRSAVA
jgi:hypothetical protein